MPPHPIAASFRGISFEKSHANELGNAMFEVKYLLRTRFCQHVWIRLLLLLFLALSFRLPAWVYSLLALFDSNVCRFDGPKYFRVFWFFSSSATPSSSAHSAAELGAYGAVIRYCRGVIALFFCILSFHLLVRLCTVRRLLKMDSV